MMKRGITVAVSVLLVVGIVIYFTFESSSKSEKNAIKEYVANLEIPYLPPIGGHSQVDQFNGQLSTKRSKAYIYHVKKIDPEKEIKKIAKKFGLENKKVNKSTDRYLVRDGKESIYLLTGSGSFTYLSGAEEFIPGENKLTKEEAIKKAKEFVEKIGYQQEYQYSDIAENTASSLTETEITSYQVFFERKINGLPVFGVDRISVTINKKGEVYSATIATRSVTKGKKVEIISPMEALNKVKQGEGQVYFDGHAEEANIEEASLVYWMEAASQEQKDVIPMYRLKGKTEKGEEINAYVAAIEQE
jgi:hypothetical protein